MNRGELPRASAERELFEETGIAAQLLAEPAAVTVRSYHEEWPVTLGISYATVVDTGTPLTAKSGQPAAWHPLDSKTNDGHPNQALMGATRQGGHSSGAGCS